MSIESGESEQISIGNLFEVVLCKLITIEMHLKIKRLKFTQIIFALKLLL